eukprot:10183638-Prorocentrum_lima.AAC.1
MTSSLVGSEMCIRDSSFTVLYQWDKPSRTTRKRRNIIDTHRTKRGAARPCLLYTSDAADDM